ncbi:unnamed protein product [Lactuca virosa]|uniref:Uncharacterized protein n=1 Tax=Lactuca virosa TaxID=75947 RepID=A0AAU9MIT2_9ASTR|nr:unnamed protein product [Lactuca virosa]
MALGLCDLHKTFFLLPERSTFPFTWSFVEDSDQTICQSGRQLHSCTLFVKDFMESQWSSFESHHNNGNCS